TRADRVVVRARDLPDCLVHLPTLAREVQRVDAPISGTVAPLDEPTLLELIDENDETAGQDTQDGAQRLLADSRTHVDDSQRACVCRSEPQDGQPFCKLSRCMRTDLRNQKCCGGTGAGVAFHRHTLCLDKMIYAINYSLNERFAGGANMGAASEKDLTKAARHRGPSLLALAVVYAALVLAGVIVPTVLAGGHHFPSPFEPEAWRWFGEHSTAALASSLLVFGAAIPLGIFAAAASSRVQFLGMKVAGIHIALFGGIASS